MKKVICIVICFYLILTGCSNPIREDLLNYVNKETYKIAKAEMSAITAYESVIGTNHTDDYAAYQALMETIIPTYREFLSELEAITIRLKTKEVRALNEKYIESANIQYNAFVLLTNILVTQDASKMTDFNERMTKARKLAREWQIEIQDLCKKNGIKYIPAE